MHRSFSALRVALVSVALLTLFPTASNGANFSGKTIEWIVPAAVGGGTDVWARFYAPLLSERLPGKPAIVIKNVPGASNTTGTNFFQARAKSDGLMILATAASTLMPYLLDDPRVKYDYTDWIVVLASPTGMGVYVQPDLGLKSAKDLLKLRGRELNYGSQGATSIDLLFFLAAELLDLKLKPVFGMSGRGPTRLAFERGEVAIDNQTSDAFRVNVLPLIKTGKAVPLFTYGILDSNGNLVRDPSSPELPNFEEAYEMAYGRKPSGQQYNTWKSLVGGLGTMLMLPKGTPPEIVNAYHKAMQEVVSAPGFAEKIAGILGPYKQVVGTEAVAHLKRVIAIDAQAKAWVKQWLTEKYEVKF